MKAEFVLRHEDGHLTLEVSGGRDAVPVTGHWPGSLRVPGIALILFSKDELPTDPVQFSHSDAYLHIRSAGAHIKFKAHWPDIRATRIDIPLDATDRHYLQLSLTNSPAQITPSGFDKQVAAAEERFQRRLGQTCELFSKYDLSREELEVTI